MRTLQATLSDRRRIVLILVGLVALTGGWMSATRAFQAPDEVWHYLRAIGVGNGSLLGRHVDYGPVPWLDSTQQAFINHDTTAVQVSSAMSIPHGSCIKPNATVAYPPLGLNLAGTCEEATPNGNFPPLGYLLPSLSAKVTHTAYSALWLMRGIMALQSLAFIALGLLLLWTGSGWSLIGALAAITPMVLFVMSVMNSSGIGIASSFAFACALLRLSRDVRGAGKWLWTAVAATGVFSILTGPIAIAFVLLDLVVFAGLSGYRPVRELIVSRRRAMLITGGLILLAAIGALVYAHAAGFKSQFGISPLWDALHTSITQQLPDVLHESVGNFASLQIPLPSVVVWLWWAMVLVLLLGALWVGTMQQRIVVVVTTVLCLAFPVLFWAWIDRFTGFGLQGREVLPVMMLIPMVAGEVIFRHSAEFAHRRSMQLTLGGTIAGIALVQLYAWWLSAHIESFVSGSFSQILFFDHTRYRPPTGWAIWVAAALIGTLLLLAFAFAEAFPHPISLHGRPRARRRVAAG